jgi:hypothetical protein
LTVSVADLDIPWQTVTLSATQLPEGSTYDPDLGVFSWTPSSAQVPGDYTARFVATDSAACGLNQTAVQVTIQVTQPFAVRAQYLGGDLQLSFPALSGESYRLEYCSDLALADWQPLQEITATQNQLVTVSDLGVGQNGSRFYRVRWMR